VVDPSQPIVDSHHHLWPDGGVLPYGMAELVTDTGSGHAVVATVFVECRAAYREGPAREAPLGETAFVAAETVRYPHAPVAAIVAHADLRAPGLDALLDAHVDLGHGLFRGIRHAAACDPHPEVLAIPGSAPPGLYADADFRRGVGRLGRRSLTYDAWHYHHQNADFAALARAVPDTVMVLDHFGTPLGVGAYAEHREEIERQWREDIAAIARCENVVAKLGGLAMPDNGFGWHQRDRPPTSDDLVAAQQRYYLHTIECFGPERCMFESNFPVDRFSVSYRVLWNAMKKMAAPFSVTERRALFSGTAARVYRIPVSGEVAHGRDQS